MKLFVLAALFAVAQCLDLNHQEWMNFKQTYGKSYKNSEEEQMRFDIFLKNKDLIQEHNQKFDAGQVPYKLRINHLADLTDEELDNLRGYKGDSGMTNNSVVFPSNSWVPKSVDWRAKGAVTPVKNQAHCGACWAFSVTGAIEGQIFRKSGELISLSEQQLIDCINDIVGCYGGRTNIGFKYAVHKGLEPERSYPYQAHDQKCRYNKTNVVADVKDFIRLPFGSDVELMKAVATIGPISVVIDSKGHPFHLYGSGVFSTEVSGDMCRDSKYLNHAVLLVGYGTENGQDYWLIKNSWGPLWGDAGYIKVSRSNSNQLCISTRAMYPVL